MPEDLDPDRELIIVPLNTALSRLTLEELGKLVREEFRMKYSIVRVDPPFSIHSVDSSFRIERYGTDALMLISCLGVSGVFPSLFKKYGTQHVLAVTDRYLANMATGELNEGAINRARDKVAITCSRFKDDDAEKILGRLLVLSLHEVGHLHWLKEHVHESQNGRYCPMLPGEYLETLDFNSADPRKFDCLDDRLCSDCRNYLMS